MDLTQTKLTRTEWDSIEVPVNETEREILSLIMEGFSNLNITKNKTMSLFTFTKIEKTKENEKFLYDKYFNPIIQKTIQKYCSSAASNTKPVSYFNELNKIAAEFSAISTAESGPIKKMKSIDLLRIQNLESNIENNKKIVYEFLILDFCNELCRYISKDNTKYAYYLYTLVQLAKSSIQNINTYVVSYMNSVIAVANQLVNLSKIIERAFIFIEQNPYLLEYEDKTLFSHQKQLFSIFRDTKEANLVLYIAPTGTGKTLSPLGLSVKYRIIFVCVARHIGLALAKSAISMEKKIAFAFGCETASDIRLHYFAAIDFTKDRKSGGIRKVDNSNGAKVEIMICDVKSYITAMHYMLAFNDATNIITYWDEPTITMDYETHDLHAVIQENWRNNKIPNVVLSCATLPKEEEIMDTLADFKSRFDNAEIHTITSYDCRKSIPIIGKDGFCALPHTMYADHKDLIECVAHCESNKTLLRYFDLSEIVKFAFYINENNLIADSLMMQNYFKNIADITMNSLKMYYLDLLKHIEGDKWSAIYTYMKTIQEVRFKPGNSHIKKTYSVDSVGQKTQNTPAFTRTTSLQVVSPSPPPSSGILITTSDAHTLTDGPTIFLTEDAKKIGNFYIQQSEIPKSVFQEIIQKIDSNNKLSSQLFDLERELEAIEMPDESKKTKMKEKDDDNKSADVKLLYKKIDALRKQLRYIAIDMEYVPNTKPHQMKWTNEVSKSAFCPNIDEDSVKDIMGLSVDNYLKVLLLLGIGLFVQGVDPRYLELMKKLAQQQDLYMIIASSDFVFGTNYNFCHGFIGKDMANMTQAKTIQSLGRIGRSAIQSTYTVRFRDDAFIYNLFKTPEENIEAKNMSKLFS